MRFKCACLQRFIFMEIVLIAFICVEELIESLSSLYFEFALCIVCAVP
jgi:hypothetical protein